MSFCVFENCHGTFSLIHKHFVVKLTHLKPKFIISQVCVDISATPPSADSVPLICCVMNSVFSRPSNGDEPITVAELVAAVPVWE